MRSPALLLLLMLAGCSPILYTPTPAITPGIDRPGQVRASAQLATPGGGHAQAAAVVVPHVGVWGAVTDVTNRGDDRAREAGVYRRQRMYEGGAFASGEVGRGWRLEGVVGTGAGRTRGIGSRCCLGASDRYSVDTDLRRSFGQFNVVREFASGAVLGYAARLAHVDIGQAGSFGGFEGFVLDQGPYLRTGGPLGFEVQLLVNRPLSSFDERDLQFDPLSLSLGLSWHLPRR